MKKVRVKSLVDKLDITYGKIYNVIQEVEGFYTLKDDVNEDNAISKNDCEEVKEPNYVMVKYSSHDEWKKRILLHDLGEKFEYRYITVGLEYEDDFLNGEVVKGFAWWHYMKPINEVEQKIEELEQKLAELKQQLNK